MKLLLDVSDLVKGGSRRRIPVAADFKPEVRAVMPLVGEVWFSPLGGDPAHAIKLKAPKLVARGANDEGGGK